MKCNQQPECGKSRCRYECPCHGSKDDRNLELAAYERQVIISAAVVHIYLEQDMATPPAEDTAANEPIARACNTHNYIKCSFEKKTWSNNSMALQQHSF